MCYLIKFNYRCPNEIYAQCNQTVLVHADSFFGACDKIEADPQYPEAINFENLTIE